MKKNIFLGSVITDCFFLLLFSVLSLTGLLTHEVILHGLFYAFIGSTVGAIMYYLDKKNL